MLLQVKASGWSKYVEPDYPDSTSPKAGESLDRTLGLKPRVAQSQWFKLSSVFKTEVEGVPNIIEEDSGLLQ